MSHSDIFFSADEFRCAVHFLARHCVQTKMRCRCSQKFYSSSLRLLKVLLDILYIMYKNKYSFGDIMKLVSLKRIDWLVYISDLAVNDYDCCTIELNWQWPKKLYILIVLFAFCTQNSSGRTYIVSKLRALWAVLHR